MKKRVKLLTTIASLCLAVALMAFGVYAASTATVSLTSSVSFATTNVAVDVSVQVVHTANVEIEEDSIDEANYTAETKTYLYERSQGTHDADYDTQLKLGAYKFTEDATNEDSVSYTITITNTSTVDYKVAFTGTLPANEDGDSVTIVVNKEAGDDDITNTTIAAGAEEKLTITYTMNNNAQDFEISTFTLSWVITK